MREPDGGGGLLCPRIVDRGAASQGHIAAWPAPGGAQSPAAVAAAAAAVVAAAAGRAAATATV